MKIKKEFEIIKKYITSKATGKKVQSHYQLKSREVLRVDKRSMQFLLFNTAQFISFGEDELFLGLRLNLE